MIYRADVPYWQLPIFLELTPFVYFDHAYKFPSVFLRLSKASKDGSFRKKTANSDIKESAIELSGSSQQSDTPKKS